MTRQFFRVYGPNTYSMAKWRRSPMVVRGALLTLWMQASMQRDEGHWASRLELEADLEADGCPEVAKVVDRLIDLRWIDCAPDGCSAHDWLDWQASMAHPSDAPAATRERKRRQRERGHDGHDVTSGHEGHDNGHDVTGIGEERRGYIEPSLRSGQKRDRLDPTVRAWITDQGMTAPNGYVLNDLKALVTGYGPEAVIAAMAAADGRTAKERVKTAERTLAPTVTGPRKGATRPIEEIEHVFEH